jgi:thiol-disulfide isomerase/thioredoxin
LIVKTGLMKIISSPRKARFSAINKMAESIDGGKIKLGKVIRNAAIGGLVGSLFNRPGTGAGIGALTALGGGKSKTITLYYANWCGHCRNFKPEWEKIKREMREKGWHVEEWDIDAKGLKIKGGAEIKSVPCVSFTGGDGVPILYKGTMSASNISESASNIVGGSTPAVEGGKKGGRKSVVRSAESALARVVKSVVDVPAKFLGMKGGELEAGKKRWSMWGGDAPVEGGEVEGGKRRRMRGGDAAPVEGGEVEGGKRRRMRGGDAPVEGGAAPVEGGDVEGGRRRHRMRGGDAVEGGAAPVEGGEVEGGKRRRMRGGESPAVEGGDVEGGRRRHRMRGGEVPAPVEGGAAPVEGGDVEGGRRRHRMRGGESPAVEGGDVEGGRRRHRMRGGESPAVEGGAVEGGEIEGGKKPLPRELRLWNQAKRSVEKKMGKRYGVMRKGSSPHRMARKIYERLLLKGGETETA